jgi:hypothetical protein
MIARALVVIGFLLSLVLAACSPSAPPSSAAEGSAKVLPNGPSAGLPPASGMPLYHLDKVGDVTEPLTKQPVIISATSDITASGFAVDQIKKDLAGGVDVVLDGLPFTAHYGIDRPDVATYFKNPAYGKAGYAFSMPAKFFGSGKHQLAVRVISKEKTNYMEGPPLQLEIR